MSRFRTSRRWRSIAAALVATPLAVTLVTQSSQAVPARDIREVQAQGVGIAEGKEMHFRSHGNRLHEVVEVDGASPLGL